MIINSLSPSRSQGFSLIELMIAVAIIGILASIVIPGYREYMMDSRRSDGIEMINRVRQAQERFFLNNMTYTTDLTDLGFASAAGQESDEGFYTVSAAACAGGINECVNITATAVGVQAGAGNLSLSTQEAKTGDWE